MYFARRLTPVAARQLLLRLCSAPTLHPTLPQACAMITVPVTPSIVKQAPTCSVPTLQPLLFPLLCAGVRDDNGARDAVVKRFLKDADSIWIVSHIGRAVNDKTAKVGWGKTDGGAEAWHTPAGF